VIAEAELGVVPEEVAGSDNEIGLTVALESDARDEIKIAVGLWSPILEA
jgi:hypothetical protein